MQQDSAFSIRRIVRTIKAFHDVDESRRAAMRKAFEKGVGVSAIAKHFEVPEREVWAAVKNDRSIGRALDQRF
jgi:hypothetical protein